MNKNTPKPAPAKGLGPSSTHAVAPPCVAEAREGLAASRSTALGSEVVGCGCLTGAGEELGELAITGSAMKLPTRAKDSQARARDDCRLTGFSPISCTYGCPA